jgi:hypothetical protein
MEVYEIRPVQLTYILIYLKGLGYEIESKQKW